MVGDISLYACFIQGDRSIRLFVILKSEELAFQHEKDNQDISVLELDGNKYYIISNLDNTNVTWATNKTENTITADCSAEEVIEMLKSIHSREGVK